jgi:hypothetical protein
MSKNVAADWLSTIRTGEQSTRSRIALDLIGHEYSDVEFCVRVSKDTRRSTFHHTLSNMCQLGEKLIELLLALIELPTTGVIDTKESHDAVDDEKSIFITNEELGDLVQKLHLMFRVDSAGICDIVLSYERSVRIRMGGGSKLACLWLYPEPLCNLRNPFRPKGTFRVYVCHLAFCTTHIFRKLRKNRHGVR